MTVSAFFCNKLSFVFSTIIILCAIYFRDQVLPLYDNIKINVGEKVSPKTSKNLYTTEELAKFNGEDNPNLYLAVLGSIYDVTKGRNNYEKGASYHYFTGKDGSRGLVTGNFEDMSKERDHVLDLSCDEITTLTNWRNTYKQKYIYKGKLIGRYYDANGEQTIYMKELKSKIKNCKIEKKLSEENKQKFPPCNMEWSIESGTKAWCTKNSGGVPRTWVGVPRQLFTPGEETPRCICVDIEKDYPEALIKEYEDCPKNSDTCVVKNVK